MSFLTRLRHALLGPPFCARDLRRRARIRIDGKPVTVDSIELCDEKDGRLHDLISLNDKTRAVALLIREPIIVHPGKEMLRA